MPAFELLYYADDVSLAKAAANEWLSIAESANRQGQPQFVALSGGRIAGAFFDAVAHTSRELAVSLENVHFFWADERCVPPDDAESNFALARKLLFRPLGIEAAQIHRIHGEDRPGEAAQAAAAEMCRIVPCQDGRPVLDVIFLGMGEDGHVASLFPGAQAKELLADEVYHAVTATKPPPHRITITYDAISAARRVRVLASGTGKEQALQASLKSGNETPLGRVLSQNSAVKIFTDIRLPGRKPV